MLAAINYVKQGMSCNRAADTHGIPRSTLKDRVSGQVIHRKNPGPVRCLSSEEETLLADYLLIWVMGKLSRMFAALLNPI